VAAKADPDRSTLRIAHGTVLSMRRGARSLVALLAIGALLSCGLTADYSGIQGGSPGVGDARTSDAGADAGDAEGVDAARDARPPAPFCASLAPSPRFCADFDEGNPVSLGWTLVDATVGSTVAIGGVAFTPPGAFLSAVDPSTDKSSARLQQTLPIQAARMHLEMRMLVSATAGVYELCALHQDTAQGVNYGIFYKLQGGALLLDVRALSGDGGVTSKVYPLGAPSGTWMHVVLDVDLGASAHLTLQQDGATVLDEAVPTSTPSRTKLFVALGIYSPQRASMQASFDDVAIDWP
jgi:hypothetical protein